MIKNNNWGETMNKEEKVDFDLSVLTLDQLIETYKEIIEFLKYLEKYNDEWAEKAYNN